LSKESIKKSFLYQRKMTNTKVNRTVGRVKWFNKKQGYGFICVLDGEHINTDIFVHFSSIRNKKTEYKYLVQGEYVECLIDKSNKEGHEYVAIDITGIYENILLCETRSISIDNKNETKESRRINNPVA